jgi:hypothetical protein
LRRGHTKKVSFVLRHFEERNFDGSRRQISVKAQEVGEPVVPLQQPLVQRHRLRVGAGARLHRQVVLLADAEEAADRTAAHRAPVQFAEAAGADARVAARQQRPRQREVLAHHAQLLLAARRRTPRGRRRRRRRSLLVLVAAHAARLAEHRRRLVLVAQRVAVRKVQRLQHIF